MGGSTCRRGARAGSGPGGGAWPTEGRGQGVATVGGEMDALAVEPGHAVLEGHEAAGLQRVNGADIDANSCLAYDRLAAGDCHLALCDGAQRSLLWEEEGGRTLRGDDGFAALLRDE